MNTNNHPGELPLGEFNDIQYLKSLLLAISRRAEKKGRGERKVFFPLKEDDIEVPGTCN